MNRLAAAVIDEYHHNWLVDSLPAALDRFEPAVPVPLSFGYTLLAMTWQHMAFEIVAPLTIICNYSLSVGQGDHTKVLGGVPCRIFK